MAATVRVAIHSLSGRSTELEVAGSRSTQSLKEQIVELFQVPAKDQTLVFGCAVLADGQLLGSLGASSLSLTLVASKSISLNLARRDNRLQVTRCSQDVFVARLQGAKHPDGRALEMELKHVGGMELFRIVIFGFKEEELRPLKDLLSTADGGCYFQCEENNGAAGTVIVLAYIAGHLIEHHWEWQL